MLKIQSLLCYTILLTLVGCGGGGGTDPAKSPSSDTPTGTPISESELLASISTGVYRFDVTSDLGSFSNTQNIAGTTYTITTEGAVTVNQLLAVDVENDTSDACDLEGVESDVSAGVIKSDNPVLSACAQNFYKLSDTEFRLEFDCEGSVPDFSATMNRISDSPSFNHGNLSLAFTSSTEEDVSVASGVCGSILKNNTSVSVSPPLSDIPSGSRVNETEFTIVAPYVKGNRVTVTFTFSGGDITAGEYLIGSGVDIEFASAEFGIGNTPLSPGYHSAIAGVVNVTSVGSRSYSGNYTVDLENADSVSGSFTINLN